MLLVCLWGRTAVAQFAERPASTAMIVTNDLMRSEQFWQTSAVQDQDETSIPGLDEPIAKKPASKKSGLLAAGLSLILPGLGEYYVGDQIWRGMIFTAIEGGVWYGRYVYNKRGDDSLVAFHAWADTLWSSSRYAASLNALLAESGRPFRITDPNNVEQINMAEDSLNIRGYPDFTHNLPAFGSQQYYELISKYDQFTPGWKDATTHYLTDSPEAQRHAYMRADMNQQYDIAQYFLWGAIVNRLLSAIDAALLAKDHNSAIHLEGQLLERRLSSGFVAYIPTAKLRWTF